jgi:ABC-type glycerol-3-phosphate transport system substrate-binding protein
MVRKLVPLKISRRSFLQLAGLASSSFVLNACNPLKYSNPINQNKKVQLVYQDWRTDWFPSMAQDMLSQFHSEHPNIRVYYTPDPEDLQDKMLVDMQAGTAPDIFQGCCTHFPTWAQLGYTLDLRPYVESDLDQGTINDWDQAQYKALFTREGQQFGLPKYHGALALYFNKDLFDEYQVDYPDDSWDHETYHNAMRRLTLDRKGVGKTDLWGSTLDISWDRLQVHVNAWGGHFVDPDDPTLSLMDEPEAMQAFEWIRARMWDENVMASPLDIQNIPTRQAFYLGKVAMVEDGSWALKDILNNANFRVGVAPLPSGPARRVTLSTTDGFGIFSGTKYPDEAWELLKFLVSKDYSRAMAEASFLQPSRASIIDEWAGFVLNEFPEKITSSDIAAFADGQIKGYSVTAEIFGNMELAKRIADEAWNLIFTLGQEPVSLMESTSKLIQDSQKEVEQL